AAFRRSGTIHLLVVSGWHMTFIAYLIRKVLGWVLSRFGIARRTVIHLTIAAIIAFTVMVGFSAPAIRGALVAIAIQAVDLLGRIGNPIRTLLLVATAMVLVHPHVLGFDLGFQLTVAATTAILLILPAVDRVLPCRHLLLRDLRDLTAASVAASLATAPLLAASFGTIAVLGALASIPILPISAAVMVLGMALFAVIAFAPLLIAPFVWALTSLTGAIVWAVERIAAVPWATMQIGRPDAWFIVALYLLVLAAIIQWYQRRDIPLLAPLPNR
ncbi:ComEC/Rec2 family competence protein, partial [Candidatus Uhrbacteria bacterium]|nr:ComEC/Rec2 family competence protein [Candidatus Uhrbacteria bacterium]